MIIFEEILAPEEASVITNSTDEPIIPAVPSNPAIPATEYPVEDSRSFTPSGAGTVIDSATDADGRLFYTIKAPDGHVFYLVIDKKRGAENVYFLNAVTVADLVALAGIPETQPFGTIAAPPLNVLPETPPLTPATTEPEPMPEQGGKNMGTLIFIAVMVALGGGAGWYFKIYRPKQQGAGSCEEYEPYADEAETDYTDDWDDEQDGDDSPPWDEGDI